ncbi:hypothetical protein [Planctomonas psychrotolerans]|uniref:hypothetical protein n=1 Tax=Planctomonas psychrotolerans TaxID=2528712 RepID=UPI001239CD16|nr:hypothetical protein [Planctomonas psychrotolerans]
MRKYILNGSILSALFGAWSTIKVTREGPHDWRLVLMWVSWAITMVIAIGAVHDDSKELDRR